VINKPHWVFDYSQKAFVYTKDMATDEITIPIQAVPSLLKSFREFEAELLADPQIRKEYEALKPKYKRIQRQLITILTG